jgi:pilus assembly protein Flp/PilA
MVKRIVRFMREEEGATAVEYGLMVALIAGGIIAIVTALRTSVIGAFQTVITGLGS